MSEEIEAQSEFSEFFSNMIHSGTDEQAQNFCHITGLKSRIDPVEFKFATVVADFIKDRRFKDAKEDIEVQLELENILMSRGQSEKRKDYMSAQRVSAGRGIEKLLPGVEKILVQRFEELQANGYFHKDAELTNIKRLGIWFNFVKAELYDYYKNFGNPLILLNAKFLHEAEKFLLDLRNEGLKPEP